MSEDFLLTILSLPMHDENNDEYDIDSPYEKPQPFLKSDLNEYLQYGVIFPPLLSMLWQLLQFIIR